jgi:hypothetical protein
MVTQLELETRRQRPRIRESASMITVNQNAQGFCFHMPQANKKRKSPNKKRNGPPTMAMKCLRQ